MSTVETPPKLKFESHLDKSLGVGYVFPNEDVGRWRELVKGKRIKRAAAICSGGEVGFFALLPTVKDELVLIDHNKASLYYALVKYLLLRKHGYAGVVKLLREPHQLKKELTSVEKELPKGFSGNQRDNYDYTSANLLYKLKLRIKPLPRIIQGDR